MASAAVVAFAALGGCVSNSGSGTPPVAVTPAVAVTASDLVGSWGLASYRVDADETRTEAQAKAACNNPYKIAAGSNGGVMMHLADQTQPSELFLKVASDGRVFLGPKGPAGVAQDRQIESFQNGVWVAKFVDPSVASRYGIFVYVNCATKTKKA